MIKVRFKNQYRNEYDSKEYTYASADVAVGDIVVVDTVNGYAIAQVSQIGILDMNYREDELKRVVSVVKTNAQIVAERIQQYRLENRLNRIAKEVKRQKVLDVLREKVSTVDAIFLENLDYETLLKLEEKIKE